MSIMHTVYKRALDIAGHRQISASRSAAHYGVLVLITAKLLAGID